MLHSKHSTIGRKSQEKQEDKRWTQGSATDAGRKAPGINATAGVRGKKGKMIYKVLYLVFLLFCTACLVFLKKKYPESFRVYLVYVIAITAAYTALWKAGGFPIFIWD